MLERCNHRSSFTLSSTSTAFVPTCVHNSFLYYTLLFVLLCASSALVVGGEDTFCRYPNLLDFPAPHTFPAIDTDGLNAGCLRYPNFNATIQSSTLVVQECAAAQFRLNEEAAEWQPYTAPVPLKNGQAAFVKCADSPAVLLINPPHFEDKHRKGDPSPNPSVFVVMVDAVAFEVLHRLMPNTLEMLKNEKDLDVFEFTKYATVGLNSNPNKFALFGRHTYDPELRFQKRDEKLPWLWEHAKKLGYTTMIAEDECPRHDSVWDLMNVPTSGNKMDPESGPDFVMLNQVCVQDPHPNKYCIKGKWGYEYVVDYVTNMVHTFEQNNSEKPIFMWSNFIDAHEPVQWAAALMDNTVVNYLQALARSKFMDNGVIVFLSDHGVHFGDYAYSSVLGAAENKHPYMYVMATKNLLKKDIVSKNQNKLVTPNDLFKTMSTLIGHKDKFDTRDFDIFNEPVPAERTCEMATIPREYCLCQHGPETCPQVLPTQLWQTCVTRYAHPNFFNWQYYNNQHLKPTFNRDFTECEAINHWCAHGLASGWNATNTDSLRAYTARTPFLQSTKFCWAWPTDCNWGFVAEYYFTYGFSVDTK